eukprot:361633-Chlamydomonas_euryale.AAC.1
MAEARGGGKYGWLPGLLIGGACVHAELHTQRPPMQSSHPEEAAATTAAAPVCRDRAALLPTNAWIWSACSRSHPCKDCCRQMRGYWACAHGPTRAKTVADKCVDIERVLT